MVAEDRRSTHERTLRGVHSFHSFHLRFTVVLFHPFFSLNLCLHCIPRQGACCWSIDSLMLRMVAILGLWCLLCPVASRCDLQDPGWGDPGFPQRAVCFFAPFPTPCRGDVSVLGVVSIHARLNRQHISCWNSHRAVWSSAIMLFFLFGCLVLFLLFLGSFVVPVCFSLFFCFLVIASHFGYLDCV